MRAYFLSGQEGEAIRLISIYISACSREAERCEKEFAKARTAGLPVAIHCGEVPMRSEESGGDDALQKAYEEAKAILQFRPNRLGHALLLADDLLMQQEKPVPIECCPTSNVMTLELALHHGGNLIDGMKKHPQLKKWLGSGYPVSVNTDDSGIFCTNLTKEFLLVAKAYAMGKSELAAMMLNSIEHIFEPEGDSKSMLRKRIQDRIGKLTHCNA